MVRKASRILSYVSALLSALTLVRLKGRWTNLWVFKMLAGAWTPFLALAGGLGALIGLARRDCKAMWAGIQPKKMTTTTLQTGLLKNEKIRLPKKSFRLQGKAGQHPARCRLDHSA